MYNENTDEEYDETKMDDLKKEFEKAFNIAHPQIQEKIKMAAALIDQAVKLSEKYGVPFRPEHRLTFISPSYLPASLEEKFPNLNDYDPDFMIDTTNANFIDGEDGWQYSQTC